MPAPRRRRGLLLARCTSGGGRPHAQRRRAPAIPWWRDSHRWVRALCNAPTGGSPLPSSPRGGGLPTVSRTGDGVGATPHASPGAGHRRSVRDTASRAAFPHHHGEAGRFGLVVAGGAFYLSGVDSGQGTLLWSENRSRRTGPLSTRHLVTSPNRFRACQGIGWCTRADAPYRPKVCTPQRNAGQHSTTEGPPLPLPEKSRATGSRTG